MKDHLPECPANWGVGDMPEGPCLICQMLRACEQRVLDLNPVALGVLIAQRARERALDAAREAVVALSPRLDVEKYKGGYDCCGCSTTYDLMEDALAAIDALWKEKT